MKPDTDSVLLHRLTPWQARRLRWRIRIIMTLLVVPAAYLMADLHWRLGFDAWKVLHLLLFVILFTLVAFGTTQALVGFWRRLRHRHADPLCVINTLPPGAADTPLPADASSAIVMPICNEDPERVFLGLRSIYESLAAAGHLDSFEFFVLSDSGDPNRWVEEEAQWVRLTKELDARGRIFYRKRRVNTNKKAGNLADFCRRWGSRHRYMVVLDADSIMSGSAIVTLVRLMEANPRTGIIQSIPRLVRGETLFARLQQFASRLYGPVFAAGLNSWQLGNGNYWGHNAIIRTAPFMEHCSLPDLPGNEPFGGRILSHDYVEAALMRRGGWAVWLATDLEGSYEEGPANLIDYAKRDRRWLQGNLQHSWLLTARDLHGANRLHLLLGIMAYLASPLWLAFLLLSTVIAYRQYATGLTVLPGTSLLPSLELNFTVQGALLFGGTLGLLFLPKLLAVLDLRRDPAQWQAFGGGWRLLGAIIGETLAFTLMAPVLMLFHTKFIANVLGGHGVQWVTQRRGRDGEPEWREVILTHLGHCLVGLVWFVVAWWIRPALALWLAPVLLGLVLAIPVSLLSGKVELGRRLRERGWFVVPEESAPPTVLRRVDELVARRAAVDVPPRPELEPDYGLLQAVLDPYVNAVHLSLLRSKKEGPPAQNARFGALRERLLRDGPAALQTPEKVSLLQHAPSLTRLHRELWSRTEEQLAPWWRLAIRQYNVIPPPPISSLRR